MIDPKRISTAGRIILGKEGHDSLKGRFSATGALAEPLPVMDGNLHHPIPVPHNAQI
jgi:hypothetical protein